MIGTLREKVDKIKRCQGRGSWRWGLNVKGKFKKCQLSVNNASKLSWRQWHITPTQDQPEIFFLYYTKYYNKTRAICIRFSHFWTFEACNPYPKANPMHSVIWPLLFLCTYLYYFTDSSNYALVRSFRHFQPKWLIICLFSKPHVTPVVNLKALISLLNLWSSCVTITTLRVYIPWGSENPLQCKWKERCKILLSKRVWSTMLESK